MHQQFAATFGDVVQLMGERVFLNIAAHQPHLVLVDPPVCFFQRKQPIAQAFHLAARKHDSALQGIEYLVIVPRFSVLGDDAFVFIVARFVFAFLGRGLCLRMRRVVNALTNLRALSKLNLE